MLARGLIVTLIACSSSSTTSPPNGTPAKRDAASADAAVPDSSLGALTFQVTEGSPAARAHFMRGLAALHSFWYDEASREFQAAIDADPKMNMAYWGAAMSKCKLLWGDDDLAAAKAFLAKMPDPDHVSPREQEWILALVELLDADDVRTSRQKFLTAMEALNQSWPDDETATFLSIALLSTIRPEDPDPTPIRKRAAALAAGVFAHNPKHPGAAHYLIHAYDTPELAPLALPYAEAYAKLAPEAFHAQHMPAHIFVRLGRWAEAIKSCHAAWDASVAAAQKFHLTAEHDDWHSLSWLVEMPFELGHRKEAEASLATFGGAVRAGLSHGMRVLYANQVSSFAMRTNGWARIDELLAPLEAPAVDEATDPPRGSASHCEPADSSAPAAALEAQAVLHARLWAAAMQHHPADVDRLLAELAKVDASLHPFLAKTQSREGLAKLDRASKRFRAAMQARAHADDRALLPVLRASLEEDVEPVGESNPTGFIVEEELADTLLHLHQAKDAAKAYAHVLERHPNRAHALLGSARAATAQTDQAAAKTFYRQLLALWATADFETDGLAEARAAIN